MIKNSIMITPDTWCSKPMWKVWKIGIVIRVPERKEIPEGETMTDQGRQEFPNNPDRALVEMVAKFDTEVEN